MNPPTPQKKETKVLFSNLWTQIYDDFLSFFLFLFRAAPLAYGDSQARGPIGATAANLHHSSRQLQILNLLSKARDQTHNLMVPSRNCFHCTTTGTPAFRVFVTY